MKSLPGENHGRRRKIVRQLIGVPVLAVSSNYLDDSIKSKKYRPRCEGRRNIAMAYGLLRMPCTLLSLTKSAVSGAYLLKPARVVTLVTYDLGKQQLSSD